MHTGIREKMIQIGYTQGDINARMKPSNILREAQQIALEHCDELGFTAQVMQESSRMFVLVKLEIHVERMPLQGETVRVRTCAYQPKRLAYQRVTAFETPEGDTLVTVDSRWTLLDTKTWRITRETLPELVEKMLPVQDCADIRIPMMEYPDELPPVTVRYTMLDINRHVNNAVYADWAQDAVEQELLTGKQIKHMQLLYHREAKAGSVVRIHHAFRDGVHYLRGEHEGGHCFEASVTLTEAE